MHISSVWLKVAFFGLICAAFGFAQTTFGVIRGRVLDPSGAAIPGVPVAVTNPGTNVGKRVTSDESGFYEASYLQPGTYSVAVQQPGFKGFIANDVVLNANAIVLVDVKLEVGELSSSVTVSAGAPLITTESAAITDVKTQKQYLDAPLNTRGVWDSYLYTFMSLVPGAQPGANGYSIKFAGTRYNNDEYTVDGISIKKAGGGLMGPPVSSMEIIQEVKVDLSGNAAEFATPSYAGVITRGGVNTLHGSLYEYYNTAGLNARSFFANSTPFNVLNNFGGSASGPVIRNKTFFSGSFEGFNQHTGASLNLNLPSQRVRAGDFSQLKDSKGNPLVIKDPRTGAPFPGAIIPADRLNATALKIQSRFFPGPNFGDSESVVGNYRDQFKNPQRREAVDVRIDHQVSAANAFFGRVTLVRLPMQTLEGNLPAIGNRVQRRQGRNMVLSDTHILRTNLINEFRFGLTRDFNPWHITNNGPQLVSELGLTNLPPDLPDVPSVPQIAISGFQGISCLSNGIPAYNTFQWQDNLSWMRGRHTFKMGGDVGHYYTSNYAVSPTAAFGNISFSGQFTGNSYADFLLGIPYSASLASSGFVRDHLTNNTLGFFFQDNLKVSPRLTINLGLRYELKPPVSEKEFRISSFDPWTRRLIVPNDAAKAVLNSAFVAGNLVPIVTAAQGNLPENLIYTQKKNFAPRVGLAYKLTSDNKTVARAAYGIFYDATAAFLNGGPYGGTVSAPPNTITNGVPLWQLPAMFPAVTPSMGTAALTGIDPHFRIPYMQQWNFTLEREIWNMGLRASYMGMKSNELLVGANVNQLLPSTIPFSASRRPFPQLSSVMYTNNGGVAFYNGLILSAERKFKNGLQYQVSHTWAKELTDAHDEGGACSGCLNNAAALQNAYDRSAEYGNNNYTRRRRFIASVRYELPAGKQQQAVLKHIMGGWTMSAFVILQTGAYFNPTVSGVDTSNTGVSSERPDRIANGNIGNPTIGQWFDRSAFVVPPNGRFGNSGVNVLEGPGTRLLNLGLFKRFQLRERLRLQVEATFTNALNHPNFNNPAATISSATAGIVQSTQSLEGAGARTTRLGMRIDF